MCNISYLIKKKQLLKLTIVGLVAVFVFLYLRHHIRSPQKSFFIESVTQLDTTKKQIALTFDDGPHPKCTPLLLDLLAQKNIKATFFVNGDKLAAYPQLAQRIVQEGHLLGNHSYYHERMIFKSKDYILQDLLKTDSLIVQAGQSTTTLYRPPYGMSFVNLPLVLQAQKMTLFNWDIAPNSQYSHPSDAQRIAQDIIQNTKNGSIILLHDGASYVDGAATAQATQILIDSLKLAGYQFVLPF